MEKYVDEFLKYMAKSHEELADTLEASKDMAVHMSVMITDIPNHDVSFIGYSDNAISELCREVTSNVTTYLNSIGDLQEAAAKNLELIWNQLSDGQIEE